MSSDGSIEKKPERWRDTAVGPTSDKFGASYGELLADLKARIQAAQIKAALAANRSVIELYLDIGEQILMRQEADGWGRSIVERLSRDLRSAFPEMKGFSPRNLWDMRRLAEEVRRYGCQMVIAVYHLIVCVSA